MRSSKQLNYPNCFWFTHPCWSLLPLYRGGVTAASPPSVQTWPPRAWGRPRSPSPHVGSAIAGRGTACRGDGTVFAIRGTSDANCCRTATGTCSKPGQFVVPERAVLVCKSKKVVSPFCSSLRKHIQGLPRQVKRGKMQINLLETLLAHLAPGSNYRCCG